MPCRLQPINFTQLLARRPSGPNRLPAGPFARKQTQRPFRIEGLPGNAVTRLIAHPCHSFLPGGNRRRNSCPCRPVLATSVMPSWRKWVTPPWCRLLAWTPRFWTLRRPDADGPPDHHQLHRTHPVGGETVGGLRPLGFLPVQNHPAPLRIVQKSRRDPPTGLDQHQDGAGSGQLRQREFDAWVWHADDEWHRRLVQIRTQRVPFGVCHALGRQGGESSRPSWRSARISTTANIGCMG